MLAIRPINYFGGWGLFAMVGGGVKKDALRPIGLALSQIFICLQTQCFRLILMDALLRNRIILVFVSHRIFFSSPWLSSTDSYFFARLGVILMLDRSSRQCFSGQHEKKLKDKEILHKCTTQLPTKSSTWLLAFNVFSKKKKKKNPTIIWKIFFQKHPFSNS